MLDTFDRGELSLDQMAAIVRKAPAWADHRVAELAPMLTVRQLQRTLGKYRFPDPVEQDQPEPAEATTEPVEPEPVAEHGAPVRRIRAGSGSVTTAASTCISKPTNRPG